VGTKGRTITEFAILSLLTERPMYGTEMAEYSNEQAQKIYDLIKELGRLW
jgi:DNA-binding PadR family transcriptional regulator